MEFSSITSLLSCEQKQMNNVFKNFALKICVGGVYFKVVHAAYLLCHYSSNSQSPTL